MQTNNKTTMLTSQETIAQLQNEILKLKLIKHQLEQKLATNLDETKRDLVADLLTQNEELRQQLEGMEEKREFKDVACQTNLDRINIDQLIEASLTLKKQKRKHPSTSPKATPQQHYPQVSVPRQTSLSTKSMSTDEKDSLEKLFKLDGLLTTTRDKLRAVIDTQPV